MRTTQPARTYDEATPRPVRTTFALITITVALVAGPSIVRPAETARADASLHAATGFILPSSTHPLQLVVNRLLTATLHNVAPAPYFVRTCATQGGNSPACIKQAVAAIEHARSFEHMKQQALILPDDYRQLSVAEQTFVVTNLERVDRGLRPYAGLTSHLDSVAHDAAVGRVDPSLSTYLMHAMHINAVGSIWASDFGPLSSDYDWMYNDGYSKSGSTNIDCVRDNAPGCWGHRDNILYPETGFRALSAGAGTAQPAGSSIAEILVGGQDTSPGYVYTWREALAHGADGHQVTQS
jgi:hypothetical protein